MIVCPVCGFRNLDANNRCLKCSALLKRDDDVMREATASAAKRMRRIQLASWFAVPFSRLRRRSWFRRFFAIPENDRYKFPFTAGFLSLVVPGTGHIYAGQMAKGLVVFAGFVVLVALAVITIREPWSNYLLLAMLLLWLAVWTDSVAVTAQGNGDTWRLRKSLALIFGAMMIAGVCVTGVQFFGGGFMTLEKVGSSAMLPALAKGDRLLFVNVPLWFRDPVVGEVVMYDPPRFSAESGRDTYSINISKYFQRVLGVGGDHLVKRGTEFYRNGVALSDAQIPFNGYTLPDFDLTVPADSFFIPVTSIPQDVMATLLGAGPIGYVGQPGYVFAGWPGFGIVSRDSVYAKGVAVLDPPERRKWLP